MAESRDEIEQIHQLKARYVRAGDTKNWALFAECLTADYVGEFEGMPRPSPDQPTRGRFEGRDALITAMGEFLKGVVTVHQAYLPEITITGDDTAKGIWAMTDHLRMPTCIFSGWGHYHEDYWKQDGVWRIKNVVVTRIRVVEEWL